ncbi:hypothetical protein [Streptomyces sp. CA-106110]|uniref:hypothetical protein n=1 Tax=Streptomyces sp. CA-106110 TaxID=3240044 RepID=UPI003D94CA5B
MILEDLRGFWLDTAACGNASALPRLPVFTHPDRALFGTDRPLRTELAVAHFTGEYDRHPASTPSATTPPAGQTPSRCSCLS